VTLVLNLQTCSSSADFIKSDIAIMSIENLFSFLLMD